MFSRESVIIKDGKKLSFDYVPDKLIGREKQMEMLSLIFRSVIDDGRSETAYITGSVGTGKTSTVRRFCIDMAAYAAKNNIGLDYVHINCRQNNTDAMVMAQCIRHFDDKYPDKGYSAEVMLRDFRSHILKTKKRFVIVLDEVNSLIRSGDDDLIYQLSRIGEGINGQLSVSLILISQEYVLDRIDVASLSTFKRANTVRFDKYTRKQLRDIVSARVDDAMVAGTVSEEAIDAITDMSADLGDARMAIDILDKAARLAEMRPKSIVTADDVASVSDMVSSVVNVTRLESLGKNELFTLLAFARATRTKPYVTLADAEKTYAIVCEEYEVPARKHTQFFGYTDTLVKDNLLACRNADEGKAKVYSIQDIPPKQMCKKLEELIEKVVR
jgi:cell division control protein 6